MTTVSSCTDNPDPNQRRHYVTAVITHRVRSGRESGYEAWIKGISAAAREFDGHLGVSILRPQSGASDYVIVLQFDTCTHLNAWLGSPTRKDWIQRAQPLIQDQETIQVLTGLEAWFQLPSVGPATPKRYKQAFLVWVGIMVISLILGPILAPLIGGLPWPLETAVRAAISVALLSYVVMPRLTRWFKGWLFS